MENTENEITYEYGAMSSKFSLVAKSKFVAYATIVMHYHKQPSIVVVYEPKECKKDSWFSMDGKCAERLDEIFGGKDSFDNFLADESKFEQVKACYDTIKRLV